jgi:hypothetical protein
VSEAVAGALLVPVAVAGAAPDAVSTGVETFAPDNS